MTNQWITAQNERRVSVPNLTHYIAEQFGHPDCIPQWYIRCGFVNGGEAKLADNLTQQKCEKLIRMLDSFVQQKLQPLDNQMFSIPNWLGHTRGDT